MGNKLTPISHLQLEAVAGSLRAIAEQLSTVADAMRTAKNDEAPLPWNQRQFTALDILIASGNEVEKAWAQHLAAIEQKRQSHLDIVLDRREKRQQSSPQTKLGPGRPRKKHGPSA